MINPDLLESHGRTMHISPVPGLILFYCPTCGRLIAMDHQSGEEGVKTTFLRKGDPYASHWGATIENLRFGGVEVRADDPRPS